MSLRHHALLVSYVIQKDWWRLEEWINLWVWHSLCFAGESRERLEGYNWDPSKFPVNREFLVFATVFKLPWAWLSLLHFTYVGIRMHKSLWFCMLVYCFISSQYKVSVTWAFHLVEWLHLFYFNFTWYLLILLCNRSAAPPGPSPTSLSILLVHWSYVQTVWK